MSEDAADGEIHAELRLRDGARPRIDQTVGDERRHLAADALDDIALYAMFGEQADGRFDGGLRRRANRKELESDAGIDQREAPAGQRKGILTYPAVAEPREEAVA